MTKKQVSKFIATLATLLLVVIFGYEASQSGLPNLKAGEYLVTRVADGDTFDAKSSTGKVDTIRMIGIDTPETHDPRKAVQCFGQAASDKTRELVEGKTVRLQADPTNSDRDKYQRLLRFVYLPDGTFINQYLVQQGYAFAYTVFPNQHLEEFRAWEKEARENNRGLWAGCNINESDQIKQTNDTP